MAVLPPPTDRRAAPRLLVAELTGHLGTAGVVELAIALLSGIDLDTVGKVDPTPRQALTYFGGAAAVALLDGSWAPWWARVWGARALRYEWLPAAESAVLAGLDDQQWRVAEHCLALVATRDLGPAGDRAAGWLDHELPRMRIAALRALAVAADTEHLDAMATLLDDAEPTVGAAAERAVAFARWRLIG